jgi:hypothetical protein
MTVRPEGARVRGRTIPQHKRRFERGLSNSEAAAATALWAAHRAGAGISHIGLAEHWAASVSHFACLARTVDRADKAGFYRTRTAPPGSQRRGRRARSRSRRFSPSDILFVRLELRGDPAQGSVLLPVTGLVVVVLLYFKMLAPYAASPFGQLSSPALPLGLSYFSIRLIDVIFAARARNAEASRCR